MTDWTRVRFPAEEKSLPAAHVASLEDRAGFEVVEDSGPWRRSVRLDTPEGLAEVGEYEALTVPQLDEVIAARNEGRDEDDLLPVSGKKADRVAALKADDA